MKDEDLLQCPLLRALDAMRRAELLGLMKDNNLRDQVGKCVASLPQMATTGQPGTSDEAFQSRDFQKDVHSWKPQLSLWRRSAKE
jgi:hypothetical protein